MILADHQIEDLATNQGMIEPFVKQMHCKGVISYGLGSMGYDLRAGYTWRLFTDHLGGIVDPKQADTNSYYTESQYTHGETFILPPNSYALTHSLEYIRMPKDVTGICLGKSTYARVGLLVNMTPFEAGWEGQVTIEVANCTRAPIRLYPGEGILQVLFFRGEEPRTTYATRNGKYQHQVGITSARIAK